MLPQHLRILLSGSTGFVGAALVERLQSEAHDVVRLVRSPPHDDGSMIEWDPVGGRIDASKLEGFDAIIHLAGENIAGRWTEKKKRAIRDSRIIGTRTLAEAIGKQTKPPLVFICASAVGIYGNRGDTILDESSARGKGFLADVVTDWESVAQQARKSAPNLRIVNLRFGLILSPDGGALGKMLTPFKLGVAGVIGTGDQWWSWIARDDAVAIAERALVDDRLSGPVNVVTPNPVTNREFTKTLGRVLGRPAVVPMPAFAAKLAFGREMAEETMLASARIDPARLREIGYEFQFPELEVALRTMLARP
jgi:uncharacterized protein